uniref:Rho guanine nucleotide exchange factor 12-like n=1 Tax=Sinocyclocheilus rhinocerous TaxID=307959 RepID=A0A673KN67_9TELE
MLDFCTFNNTLKINWAKHFLKNPTSVWNFIPQYIFSKFGGFNFVLLCNYNVEKIPAKLSKFHKQVLLAWSLLYKHNFSPHKYFIWNNRDILYKNRSLFFQRWFEEDILLVSQLFNANGLLLNYEEFLNPYFLSLLVLSLPPGLVQRCVIIQKDENSFGLTVSGDNPVFVQLVKQDGAAMRAGVQTGDRIIKVNGTLVTQSNHVEVVKLIKSGSYVALTVLGRPPGLPQIPLSEVDVGSPGGYGDPFVTSPNSYNADIRLLPFDCVCVQDLIMYRTPTPKPLRDIQEAKKHIPHQQGHTHDSRFSSTFGSPPSRLASEIIAAEDDDFDIEQEQVNGLCNCFQSIELLKSRPAHLAVFLHHVISLFDPAPLLCYLYADLYKQTNSKETRRIFMDFLTFFIDRGANLKVAVPESISSELERRRPELIPEELHRQYIQTMQETLLPDVQRNLEDFRQKRSMGLTLADVELSRLDSQQLALERERSCAENILSKIDDVLLTSQTAEEEKFNVIQYVIFMYMKHLGVRVKEQRNLESKRVRINFLPSKLRKSKTEKEGEEKLKKPRFPIRVPARWPSRIDSVPCKSKVKFYNLQFEELQSEDDQGSDVYSDVDPPNWQQVVGRDVLAGLMPHEIKRQEVINELFYTERTHVRMLKVLDSVFYQKLTRDNILPPADIKNIFTNLEEIIQLHSMIADQMTAIRKKNESSVVDHIGDELLSWFSGGEEEKIKQAVGTFCSNQPFALELIKSRQKKDQRFTSFIQEAESNRLCRRLQLKDIIPAEMQRFTKYPLLMDNIVKYTDESEEKDKVRRAAECCRHILSHVNQSVKESENKQRLEDYQRRLDLSSLKQSENPMISEFKNLDLTKRKMVHEGPLSWKINKDKTIELYTLLLEDILVLMQKQDERLILRCHSKNLAGTADTKHIFSPIIKLSTVLVRSVATDNRSFFVISMSKNGAQIYELMAQTVATADCSKGRCYERQTPQRHSFASARVSSSLLATDLSLMPFLKNSIGQIGRQSPPQEHLSRHRGGSRCGTAGSNLAPKSRSYLVLEGYGGPGESSTDDDIQVRRKESSLAHSCAADSGISLKFSSPSSGSTSRLSRQVLSHIRCLQANLNHLKVCLLLPLFEFKGSTKYSQYTQDCFVGYIKCDLDYFNALF